MLPQSMSTTAKTCDANLGAGILPIPRGQPNRGTLCFHEAYDCN